MRQVVCCTALMFIFAVAIGLSFWILEEKKARKCCPYLHLSPACLFVRQFRLLQMLCLYKRPLAVALRGSPMAASAFARSTVPPASMLCPTPSVFCSSRSLPSTRTQLWRILNTTAVCKVQCACRQSTPCSTIGVIHCAPAALHQVIAAPRPPLLAILLGQMVASVHASNRFLKTQQASSKFYAGCDGLFLVIDMTGAL